MLPARLFPLQKFSSSRFLHFSKAGQGIMEYMILSTFIGIFCLLALKQLGTVLEKRIDHLKSQIVEHMKIQ